MRPETAVLKASNINFISLKICGLYVLERNIMVLARSGIKKIYLDLSGAELDFFNTKIRKHIKNAGVELIHGKKHSGGADYFVIPSNVFMQQHYISQFDKWFRKSGKTYVPETGEEFFVIEDKSDVARGAVLLKKYIIQNTGGFIAQKINKRISIPVSIRLSRTRIHPNYLTVFNMFIGLLSSYFIVLCADKALASEKTYIYMVLGGFLFQAASILDGVDGEVAKFTLKVSKIGGWLDTFSDNMTLLLFLVSNSYLFYINMGGLMSAVTILVMFTGLAVMLGIMFSYLSKFSDSGSLVTYDREFLQKLPADDRLVKFALSMKYLTKKEMFSIVFFMIALTGRVYFIIPMAAFVLAAAAIILTVIHFRYIGEWGKKA